MNVLNHTCLNPKIVNAENPKHDKQQQMTNNFRIPHGKSVKFVQFFKLKVSIIIYDCTFTNLLSQSLKSENLPLGLLYYVYVVVVALMLWGRGWTAKKHKQLIIFIRFYRSFIEIVFNLFPLCSGFIVCP